MTKHSLLQSQPDTRETVFVVDDDKPLREALELLLRSEGFEVRTFASAASFAQCCSPALEGCLILDVGLPDMDGLELQQQLALRGISVPIIILTGQGDVPKAVQAIKAGAMHFLEKPADTAELLTHVRAALAQNAKQREQDRKRSDFAQRLAQLTPREREVMVFVASGLPSKDIARRLEISYRTVEGYRQRVREKTGTSSLPELVEMAQICGLIP